MVRTWPRFSHVACVQSLLGTINAVIYTVVYSSLVNLTEQQFLKGRKCFLLIMLHLQVSEEDMDESSEKRSAGIRAMNDGIRFVTFFHVEWPLFEKI